VFSSVVPQQKDAARFEEDNLTKKGMAVPELMIYLFGSLFSIDWSHYDSREASPVLVRSAAGE